MLRKIGLLAVALTLTVGALLPVPAQAHHEYPDNYWPAGVTTFQVRLHENTGWSQAQMDAITAALVEIVDVPNSQILFNFNTENRYNWQDPCNLLPHILIEKVGTSYFEDSNTLAKTTIKTQLECGGGSFNQHVATRVQVETPGNSYWGPNVPEPVGDRGMRGLLVHEIVHALGFAGQQHGHWDVAGHSGWCVDANGQQNWRTMCSSIFTASSGDNQENRSFTLHDDDQTYLAWRY